MYKSYFKQAFTLSEVLITLGIIGIIAAMTLPSVIADARKKSTAAHLKKFYNTINNAVQFAIAENGDVENWMGTPADLTYEENLDFLKKYFLPYIKYNRYDKCMGNSSTDAQEAVCVYMTGGGMFAFRYDNSGGDIFYFVDGKYNPEASTTEWIRNVFAFQFNKTEGYDEDNNIISRNNIKTTVEPYAKDWNGTYESLINDSRRGCNRNRTNNVKFSTFCTKLIQMNNWEITDDFPW